MTFEELIKIEREKEYFKKLEAFLEEEYKSKIIFPPKDEVFNAFSYCPLNKVKKLWSTHHSVDNGSLNREFVSI